MTATIAAARAVFPDHVVDTEQVRREFQSVFRDRVENLETYTQMLDHSGIRLRHLTLPIEQTSRRWDLGERNSIYIRECQRLGQRAAELCLQSANVAPRDVDCLIALSCTGFMIPALDAYLINRMGFRQDVTRLPVTGMGCAAGAWSLGRARDHALVEGASSTLIVSVELPSLTFQRDDLSPANLVSSVLFGDAAVALLVDSLPTARGLRILDSRSVLFPETTDLTGFNLDSSGFHIVLDRKIPLLVAREARPQIEQFLRRRGLRIGNVGFWALHPGGKRILDSIADSLDLEPAALAPTLAVWSNRGNLSSATVLCVLEEILKNPPAAGAIGVALAFGPGFCMEMALLEWAD